MRDILNDKQKRRKRNVRKVTWPLLVPIVLVLFGFGVYKIWSNIYAKRCISGIPEPTQTDIESGEVGKEYDAKAINGRSYHIKMEYLARYDIKGLVVATYDYYDGKTTYDMAFPRDLSLSWGKMAELNNSITYKHGNRKLSFQVSLGSQLSRNEMHQTSNNHLTTDNEEILKKIRKVRNGDYIELKGYLVHANVSSDAGSFELTSSLTRLDHMDGAFDRTNTGCEVIYVEEIYWLNDDGSMSIPVLPSIIVSSLRTKGHK